MENHQAGNATELLSELARGLELTRRLQHIIDRIFSSTELQPLVHGIHASWERAMALARPSSETPATAPIVDSPWSVHNSPMSGTSNGGANKKRKIVHTWTTQVRVCSGEVLEGATEDGYSWRKYGQKHILGTAYPRGYYRCSHQRTQGCMATKQVQRSNDNPTVVDVAYRDPTVQTESNTKVFNLASFSFPSIDSTQLMGESSIIMSATAPDSSYHPLLNGQLTSRAQSEPSDIVSAATSTTSPAIDLCFGLEYVDFDLSFPFQQ